MRRSEELQSNYNTIGKTTHSAVSSSAGKINPKTQQLKEEFEKLYVELSDAVFRHCYFRVFDREKARDLMQETFIRVWRYLAQGKTIDQPRAFVYRVAHNLIVNEITRRKPVVSFEELQEKGFDVGIPEHKKTEVLIEAHRILQIAEKLDKETKDIVMMRFVDDLDPAEIADVLNLSANIVSVRLNRAIHKLRDLMNHE